MACSRLGLLRSVLSFTRSPLLPACTRVPPLLQHRCPHPDVPPPCYARHYATKKSKAKAKGQTGKVSINAALVEDIISLEEVKEDMATVLETLKDDFSRNLGIRTSAGALDHITVTTKDGKFPLNQLGQISMKSPQVTREHRENLSKLAKQFSNKAKESVRRVRTNALTHVKKVKEGVSEDTIRLIEKQVQQMADSYTADIDKQLATKTKELLG
uniref:Ribosome-recycling factor, mitochondrial n=1 Tax=Astyanax mexicanus TaxID=7994 RepID=A0A8B9JUZ8_ASTMX